MAIKMNIIETPSSYDMTEVDGVRLVTARRGELRKIALRLGYNVPAEMGKFDLFAILRGHAERERWRQELAS